MKIAVSSALGGLTYKLWFYTDHELLDYMSDDISKPEISFLSFPDLVGQASHRRYPHSKVTYSRWSTCIVNRLKLFYVCDGAPDSALTLTNAGTFTATTTITITTTVTATTATASYITGSKGKKKGNGFNGYCCSSSNDCCDSCIKGKYNGPKAPTTTTTTALQCAPTNAKGNDCCTAKKCQK
ncbi:uncharacterized protein RHIMIDRAFT_292177 [Rhizopus microsporus ATCC 52813]|uniref:Uncharacterized protein n=1 Tax=Rhizopus microsporus ATCC 52813 TaxID=1340429 RepID=A0A2G4ST89_RHIZD|nr:uncharacterized protein RHIMIDRAFT_292177 [Rhizopus microsporus ATCC 52813]PHZ12007.1 hypothetical protein RHIMIDRAFT_292177 [Rhizopus microsporus ATCC 52813]